MEFWGVEVKHGESLKVDPKEDEIIKISTACLGEVSKDKGSEPVSLYVMIGGQKLQLGTLSSDKFPQTPFDLAFEKQFELSHNWKYGSVFFTGFRVECYMESSYDDEDSDDSEGEDIPLDDANDSEGEDIPLDDANGKPVLEVNGAKPVVNEAQQKNTSDPRKNQKDNEKDASIDNEEDSDSSDSDELCKRKAVDSLQDSDQQLKAKDSGKGFSLLKAKDSGKGFSSLEAKDSGKGFSSLKAKDSGKGFSSFKILTYNVWYREDLELHKRMKAIGDLVLLHSPDFICFQEITPYIYGIFKRSTWWNVYHCSVSLEKVHSRGYFCMLLSKLPVKSFSTKSFSNSIMERELCIAEVEDVGGKSFVVATSHLESPNLGPPKWDQMFIKERVDQVNEALNLLKRHPNVVFGGDMTWDDKKDGQYPLQDGWLDAWSVLRPNETGWTYDTKSNQMLKGKRTIQKRLDRFVCHIRDFKIDSIEMIGMDVTPGVRLPLNTWFEKKVRGKNKQLGLPVLPSDHYGLLWTLSSK